MFQDCAWLEGRLPLAVMPLVCSQLVLSPKEMPRTTSSPSNPSQLTARVHPRSVPPQRSANTKPAFARLTSITSSAGPALYPTGGGKQLACVQHAMLHCNYSSTLTHCVHHAMHSYDYGSPFTPRSSDLTRMSTSCKEHPLWVQSRIGKITLSARQPRIS